MLDSVYEKGTDHENPPIMQKLYLHVCLTLKYSLQIFLLL